MTDNNLPEPTIKLTNLHIIQAIQDHVERDERFKNCAVREVTLIQPDTQYDDKPDVNDITAEVTVYLKPLVDERKLTNGPCVDTPTHITKDT